MTMTMTMPKMFIHHTKASSNIDKLISIISIIRGMRQTTKGIVAIIGLVATWNLISLVIGAVA